MQKYQIVASRMLLALVFLGIVLLKLSNIMSTPDGYLHYQMTLGQFGLPSIFAPLLILVQFVAGLALFVGYKTKWFALVLAVLAVFLGVVLSQLSFDLLFLYLGVAGGMLMLSAYPQTACSLDNLKK